MIACRTAISELAKGDKDLESKGVGLLMSMVGYGMLISPALGGFLSEPLRQYPNANILGGHFDGLLTKYPFLPPNIIACVLSILAGVNVVLSVRETLPEEKRRHWTHAGQDLFKYMLGLLGFDRDNHPEEPSSTVSSSPTTATGIEDGDEDAEWEEDMKILDSEEFSAAAALMATRDSRASYSSALRRSSVASRRRSSVQEAIGGDIEKAPTTAGIKAAMPTISSERTPLNPQDDKKASLPEGNEKVSMGSIMGNETTRTYLVSYWAIAFTSVCQQEAFPLFAMSHFGGLGLEEKTIGIVGTLSGLMFCIGQYFIFTQAMKLFGLVRALRMGAFWGNVPVILMPFSLFMTGWIQILYLSFITGTLMICGSVYLGCNTIGANRTVDSSQRAAMNGLSSLGTSVGRGLGPIVAGFLVAFSMTSGVIPAEFGGWFIYLVLGTIGLVSYWSTLRILDPDEEPDNE
jgi:MFS family permease